MFHVDFSRRRPRRGNFTSDFVFWWLRSIRKVEIYLPTKFRRDISIHGWDITISGFCKQTSATLKFYFWFFIFTFASTSTCHSASACQISSKLGSATLVMTSYPFSRWRPRHRSSTSDFVFRDFAHFGKSKSTRQTKFRQDISIRLNPWLKHYYFRFRLSCLHHNRHVILHLPIKFRPNRTIRDVVMTSYPFFKMSAVSHIKFFQGNCRPITKCNEGLSLVLKFRLDRIYSFGDIAIFMLWGFGLKLPT